MRCIWTVKCRTSLGELHKHRHHLYGKSKWWWECNAIYAQVHPHGEDLSMLVKDT